MAQDSTSKSLDAEHFLHHFTDKEMVTTQHIISLFFFDFSPLKLNNFNVADLFC
jgi:hypothetical protein